MLTSVDVRLRYAIIMIADAESEEVEHGESDRKEPGRQCDRAA